MSADLKTNLTAWIEESLGHLKLPIRDERLPGMQQRRSAPLTHRASALLLALVLLHSGLARASLTYVFDELLWTKEDWAAHKLPYPWTDPFTPHDHQLLPPELQLVLADMDSNSLEGPIPARKAADELTDGEPGEGEGDAAGHPHLFNSRALLEGASQAVQCTVCEALIRLTWEQLVEDLRAGLQVGVGG